jgi:Reverse transcriptase (RNA-dependent DNA polymerase)
MGRAAGPRARFGALPRIPVRRRRHGKYVLVADVAEYYRTVYTHSIPWALHTKAVAHLPANFNNTTLLGVRLDRALRNTQGLQTNGIPIGPDTSFVIGEIILAAVDTELMTNVQPISALRYYDDYELVFERYSEAEEALAALHSALATYNLQLNAQKTLIHSLPMQLDNPWRGPLRAYAFGQTDEATQRLLLAYFDLVFSLKRDYPSDAVVGYAISRLESLEFEAGSWGVLQDLLLQTISVEPDSLQQIALCLLRHTRMDIPSTLKPCKKQSHCSSGNTLPKVMARRSHGVCGSHYHSVVGSRTRLRSSR